ncbi:MAG TPA: Rpn family recombination-promoting nuclease/putative transposase [Nostocaceae cyanobacterium]|nr:Rpn family recombination-promoting nuclease/putative transposase [Nostocaceae cyanobacterium]
MKTDSIFYRLFQEFPSIFFELIGYSPEIADSYQFSSVEVKQTAFRIDGVFLPETAENSIYFVEVQFQTDEELYSRLISEICIYLRQNKPVNDWGAVVLYPSRSIDAGNIKHYREYFSSQRVRCIYLDELGEIGSLPVGIATIKLIIEPEETALNQARELIERVKQNVNLEISQEKLLQLLETIIFYKFTRMSREEIQAMFGLSDVKNSRFYQEAFQEGKQEGKQEGIEEGRQQERLKAVAQFLKLGLTAEQIALGLSLSLEEVRRIMENQTPDSSN